jgi:hypothetical protein
MTWAHVHRNLRPVEKGICPVCAGTCRVPAGDDKYKKMYAGYDLATDTQRCCNCGGQTMSGNPLGVVKLRPDGTPCTHQYTGKNIGRCLNSYTCTHCGDTYSIDSGD